MIERRIFGAAFALIVVLAVYLRLAHLDMAEFKRDEAQVALMALDLVAGRHLPLVGIGTSVPGLENGPVMVYLTAIPLLVARDAALASGFIALLNVVALIVSARVAERVFGRLAALLAASAYAVGSWAVMFSRKLWPNEAMPVFSALLALALYEAVVAGRARGLTLAGLWLGLLVNLHPSGIVFVPVVAVAVLLRPTLLRTRGALLAGALVLLVSAPFLTHEIRFGFPALRAVQGTTGSEARVDGSAFELATTLVGPTAYGVVTGDLVDQFRARAWPDGELGWLTGALLVVGVLSTAVQLVRAWRRGAGWRAPALVLCWLLLPLVVASRRTVTLQIYYLISLIPLLFPFVGAALALPSRLLRNASRPLRSAAVGLPVAVLLWASAVQIQHFNLFFELIRDSGARTPYGAPLIAERTAADRALSYAGGRPIALVSQPRPGESADDMPPVWRFLIPETTELRFDDGGGAIRLTPGGSLYAVAPASDPLVNDLLGSRGGSAGKGVPVPGLDRGFEFWRAGARAPSASETPIGRLGGSLRLDEASFNELTPRADPIQVVTDWRLDGPPPGEELAFFVQLQNDRGEQIAGRDRSGVEAWRLEPGDELLTWATITPPPSLPPGRYWLALGARRTRSGGRLPASDPDNRPAGDQLRLGPLKIPVPSTADAPSSRPPIARFGPAIDLSAAQIPAAAAAGGQLAVDLTWMARARPNADYTVFVHLVDPTGKIAAQDDRQPVDRGYPTGIWDAGERVIDRHPLTAPAPGLYTVRVGLYDANTLKRLPRMDAALDYVDVGTIEVH